MGTAVYQDVEDQGRWPEDILTYIQPCHDVAVLWHVAQILSGQPVEVGYGSRHVDANAIRILHPLHHVPEYRHVMARSTVKVDIWSRV